MKSIDENPPAPIYLVRGDERYLQDSFIGELRRRLLIQVGDEGLLGLNVQRFEDESPSLSHVLAAARQLPMFAPRRLVITPGDVWFGPNARRLSESDVQLLKEYLSAPAESTSLIFVCRQTDRRLRIVKRLEQAAVVVECKPLSAKEAPAWVIQAARAHGVKITSPAAQLLVALVGPDLQRLNTELEKAMAFAGDGGVVEEEHIRSVVTDSGPVRIFDLLDSVALRRVDRALLELTRLLDKGEPPLMVLAMITRQARTLLQVQLLSHNGHSRSEIQNILGLHPFVLQKLYGQINYWSQHDAATALMDCIETETSIKTGRLQPEAGLELLVVRLAGRFTQQRR